MGKTKYDCVFRTKRISQDRPRVGTPDCVKPGDLLTYFDDRHAYRTRIVESVHRNYVVVAALVYEGHVLDGPGKVAFEDMYEAMRPVQPPPEPVPAPEPEPEVKPPKDDGVDVLDFLAGAEDG